MRSRSLIARPANVATIALSLHLLALPLDSAAQLASGASSPAPGTRVRLILTRTPRDTATDSTDDARRVARRAARRAARGEIAYVGTLLGATERSVVLREDRSRDTVEIARDSITRTQVSMGRSRNKRVLKGVLIGATLGAVVGLATGDDCSGNDFVCFDRGETIPLFTFGLGTLGGLIGAITWREQWKDAPAISLAPGGSGGLSMRATLAF